MNSYQKEDILSVAKILVDFYSLQGINTLQEIAQELGLPVSKAKDSISITHADCAMGSIRNLSLEDKIFAKKILDKAFYHGGKEVMDFFRERPLYDQVILKCGLFGI